MKSLKFAAAAAGLLLISAPAIAQYQSDSDKFLEAVEKRDGDAATQLIQSSPNIIDYKNAKGETALLIAIRAGEPNWIGFLLNKGANPNAAGANGETPLIAAARTSDNDAAGWLIELGAKIDTPNRSGETPLIIAVQQRNGRLVRTLLDAGADPDHADSVAGYSARDYAKRDARARDIQQLIDAKKPPASAAK